MQGISIHFLARRTGIAASALRYYETHGLLKTQRNLAGQRRYPRSDIRRVSIMIIAQKFGFCLRDIKELPAALPQNRSPTAAEWALVSQAMRAKNPASHQLTGSIGKLHCCGCLSMNACHLINAQDHLAKQWAGPMRFAMQAAPLPASASD